MERTFVMIKPDGVRRGLIGDVIARIERKGLKIAAAKMIWIDRSLAEEHYDVHRGKPFFNGLIRYITSGPVLVMVVAGEDAIEQIRRLVGATDPKVAAPGTIRGDLALSIARNIVHASDGPDTALREISLFFSENEIHDYERSDDPYIY